MQKMLFFIVIFFLFTYHIVDAQIIKDKYYYHKARKYERSASGFKNYYEGNVYEINPWTDVYKKSQDTISLVTDKLINIAIDSTKGKYDRRSAIFLLGEIGTDRAFQFLLDNFNFFMPKSVNKGDGDVMMEKPCRYILYKEKNWALIPVLLKHLEKKKEKWELKDYADLMTWICGQKVAIGMMDGLAKDASSSANLRLNASYLKEFLEE